MSEISRRRLIQFGLGSTLMPLMAWAASSAAANQSVAESFLNGGMKGFAVDSIENLAKKDIAYFEALAATGANVARVAFPFQKCHNCTQFGRSPANVVALRRILDWAATSGVKIIVVGVFDDQDTAAFWHSQSLRDSFVANWEWFAKTFVNDPALAGLDLLNEPNPPSASGKVAEGNALWRPLAERAITAIRAAGVTLPIIFEGVGGGQAVGLIDFLPFADPQVVYSIHFYTPHDITHQHVAPRWARTIPYPAGPEWQVRGLTLAAGKWDRSRLELELKGVIAFQQRYKVPIYVGEFSCVRWAPDGSAARYVADCLAIFKKYGWSWTYLAFRSWPGWDAEIAADEPRYSTTRSTDTPTMALLLNALGARK